MPPDRTPGDFGSKLRDARERRGVSLRQIANATKISVSVLEALERNDISRLPGGIFSRGFVRSYAIEVGLDPEETIQDFIAQFPNDSVTAGHPAAEQIEDNEALESDRRMASTFLRLLALSVPLALAVLYFGTAGRRARAVAEPAGAAAPVAITTPAAVATPAAGRTPASVPGPAPEKPGPPAAPATPPSSSPAPAPAVDGVVSDRLTVGLSATRPCWVTATVDGRKLIERVLRAGEERVVEVRRELVLTAGDASAITMTLNGRAARPLGKSGEVVTARLNLANYKDYLSVR